MVKEARPFKTADIFDLPPTGVELAETCAWRPASGLAAGADQPPE